MFDRPLRTSALVLGSLIYLAGASEALCRLTDGYAFDSWILTQRPTAPIGASDPHDAERTLLEETRIDPAIDPNLFFTPPVAFEKPVDPALTERSNSNPKMYGQENYVWNDALFKNPAPDLRETLSRQTSPTLFAFGSSDGTILPRFQLYPDSRTNLGTTNHFGWLSPDITLDKPSDTVRVGILGDSTSHNTYGLYLQAFLQGWAQQTHPGLRFEVENTARQGLWVEDNVAILRQELAPTSPDYVILTQASAVLFSGHALWRADPGVDTAPPPAESSWVERAARRALKRPASWSALARHTLAAIDGILPDSVEREPRKPSVALAPPFDTVAPPTLKEARSFSYFQTFLNGLDAFAKISRRNDITPIVTTERACAYPGMAPNRTVNPYLFANVNGPVYWPLTYKQIQRVLWFDNAAIQTWALANGVAVIDLERLLPKEPALCSDMMHDVVLSQRLRAWLIFQSLVPTIEADLARGHIPQAASSVQDARAPFPRHVLTLDRAHVVASFPPVPTQ